MSGNVGSDPGRNHDKGQAIDVPDPTGQSLQSCSSHDRNDCPPLTQSGATLTGPVQRFSLTDSVAAITAKSGLARGVP